jgi:predicted dehydrogenase
MKIYNVGLIGYGRMGKIYAKEIYNNKKYRLIEILRQRDILKNSKKIKNFFKLKKINLLIIASPIKTHFKYLEQAYKLKKNIIIEKPIVENNSQLKKLIQLNKNFKKKIIIHHNDVINLEKINFIKKNEDLKKINKIEMFYGKKEKTNSYKKPFFDWLPHPLSIIINFFGVPKKIKILDYNRRVKKKLIIEKLNLLFNFNTFPISLIFSNSFRIPSKKIIIYEKDKYKIYNGYKKNNQRSIKFLLEKFYKKNKINDVNKNKKVYELLFKIEKLMQKNFN